MTSVDEKDRLYTAKRYLLKYSPNSQEFEAALQHVKWVYDHDNELVSYARAVIVEVLDKRKNEKPIAEALLREFGT